MLSQTSEHALRAVLYLARHSEAGSIPADTVARALGAPRNYLAKTLNVLARRGILASLRGPTGGFRLAADADAISLYAVVEPFEEPRLNPVCMLGDRPCDRTDPCGVHGRWTAVMEDVWAPLRTTTIAMLLAEPEQDLPFAGTPSRHHDFAAFTAE
jgi:Rrf2 family transcriptional regulator, iron-sulfur cluster assembly transcription factor